MIGIHSFHWYVQNAMIPCHSQELLPFLSVMYFFLPLFSTTYVGGPKNNENFFFKSYISLNIIKI